MNAYIVQTKEERSYVEPVLDDGNGPRFPCWPIAPVLAETPAHAKRLFLDAYADNFQSGVFGDDWTALRVRLLMFTEGEA